MTKDRAEALAMSFIQREYGRPLEMAAGARPSPRDSSLWAVTFLVTGPNGEKFDGPLLVIIDSKTSTARFGP